MLERPVGSNKGLDINVKQMCVGILASLEIFLLIVVYTNTFSICAEMNIETSFGENSNTDESIRSRVY